MNYNNTMNIIVTGGSGFVGSNLITSLRKNHNIKNIDKKNSAWHKDLTEIIDITNKDSLDSLNFDADTLIHLAAEHRDDISPKSLYYDVNVGGTENLINYAVKNNINTIIFFSSVAVYGFAKIGTDEAGKINPFNDYGRSKWEAEVKLNNWYKQDSANRSLVIIRPTVIFGPRNRGNFFNLINQINSDKFIMIGSGKNKKSLAYISNIVDFVLHTTTLGRGKHLFNYVDKPESDMNSIVRTIYKCLNKKMLPVGLPYFFGYIAAKIIDLIAYFTNKKFPVSSIRIKKFCLDTSFNTKAFSSGFRAKYSIDEAISQTIDYEFKSNKNKDDVIFFTE